MTVTSAGCAFDKCRRSQRLTGTLPWSGQPRSLEQGQDMPGLQGSCAQRLRRRLRFRSVVDFDGGSVHGKHTVVLVVCSDECPTDTLAKQNKPSAAIAHCCSSPSTISAGNRRAHACSTGRPVVLDRVNVTLQNCAKLPTVASP